MPLYTSDELEEMSEKERREALREVYDAAKDHNLPSVSSNETCAQADEVYHFWKRWRGPNGGGWRESFVTVMKDCKSRGLTPCVKVENEVMKELAERTVAEDRLDMDAVIICDPEAVQEFQEEHT